MSIVTTTGPLRTLGIDDERDLRQCGVLCRNYFDGIKALEHMGPWDVLYLDHDISSYERDEDNNRREYTGYDVMCWIEANPQYKPGRIELVTANPAGRVRMQVVIDRLYNAR